MKNSNLKRILVTGGARGIGAAIVERLAQDGFAVSFSYCHNRQGAQALVERLTSNGYTVDTFELDVTERETTRARLSQQIEEKGAFWGIILNAGITADAPLVGLEDEDWDRVLKTDLEGFYNVLKPTLMPMARLREGRVVSISSVSGIAGTRGQTNYSAAKAGLIGASKALAVEMASRNITVNVVAPGLIETDMISEENKTMIVPMIPMKRAGQPHEVASVVSFLCSRDASYVTRAVIPVCGGLL